MDEILQKAKELGMLIANSQEFALVKATEEAQLADEEATKLMMEYSNTQDELSKRASAPDVTKEEFENIRFEAQKAFEKICENKNIKAYLDANRTFSAMIEQVNAIIGYFVKGGDSSGCSGNCSSCGGCK
ncbi:MAG: YlbF family regulator [Clostridia bacterium]|nr:YlbF family regulator [Clostridia bacterium]